MPLGARDVLFILRAQDFASRSVMKAAGSFGALGKQADAANAAQARLATNTIASGARLAGIGALVGATGVAGIAAMGGMASASAEFRQQVALAQTQAEDVKVGVDRVGASIADLEQVAFRVGAAVPVPLEQLSGGLYDIFSSIDVNLEGGRKLLNQFAQDAVAGQVELEDASRANIAVMNAWGEGAEGVTDISDTMFRLVERGIGSYGEFTNSIGRAIPATVRAGQEFDTLGASMAYLTRQGLSTERAATSTARAFELLADPRVVDDLEAIGVQMLDTQGNFLPMVDILEQISDKWGHLPAPERAAQMMEVFSGAGYRIQARRFLDTVIPGFEKFNTEVERMADRSGAAQRAYNTMFAQPQSQVQLLINNLKILVYEIGENFFGVINKIVGAGISFVNMLRSIDPRLMDLITGFFSIVSVALTLSGILLVLRGSFRMISGALILVAQYTAGAAKGVASLAASATGARAAMGGLSAFLLNPWVLAFAAATIAVVGIVTALKRMDEQTESSSGMAERLAGSVDAAFVAVEDMSGELEEGGASLAKFRRENQLTARQLREMGDEAARMRLIEIGVQLKYRSDLEPDEIEQHLARLAQQAGIVLEVPVRFGDLEGITAVESAMNTAMSELRAASEVEWGLGTVEDAWGTLNRTVHQTKEELDSVAELATSAFLGGGRNIEDFASNIDTMRTSIENSNAPIEAQINALDHLSDVMGQSFGDVDTSNIKDFESMLRELYDQTLISKTELLELQIALGMDTGYTEAELSARRHEAALADIPGAANAAGTAAEGAGNDFAGMGNDVDEATNALQDYHNELLGQTDPVFKAINAQHQYESSVLDVTKAEQDLAEILKSDDATTADIEESRLALREANLAVAESDRERILALAEMVDAEGLAKISAEGLREALNEAGFKQSTIDSIMADTELVNGALERLAEQREVDVIIDVAKANKVSDTLRSITNEEGEIIATASEVNAALRSIDVPAPTIAQLMNDTDAMVDLINKVARDWNVDVSVHTWNESAIGRLESQLRSVTGKTWQVRVNTTSTGSGVAVRAPGGGGWITRHEGGWADDSSGVHKLGDLKSDEIPAILQQGEYVLSRKMVAQLKDVMRFHEGGYVVKRGDTLSGIAQDQMGDASLWKQIHEANQGKIGNPDLIFPGQTLSIPHGHKGSGGGSGGGAGRTRVQRTRDILAAGGSSGEIQAAIDKVNELQEAWEKSHEAAEKAKQRASLVKDINAAEDAKERREATKALKEWDREQARAREQAKIAAQLERAEARKQIALNREQWKFDQLTTESKIEELTKRIKAEKRYTDEWIDLYNQRKSLEEQIISEAESRASEAESAYEDSLSELNRMLDERESLLEQMAERETQYNEDVAQAHKDYADSVKQAQQDATESIENAVEARRNALEGEFELTGEGIMPTQDYADLAREQNRQIQEWHQGLLELQRRGVSADVIEALGLADSPDQLEAVRQLLNSSVGELDELNEAIAERQATLNDIIEQESSNTMFELSQTISKTHRELATELENLQSEHQNKLVELQNEFNSDMASIQAQIEAIGQDNGRTWSEAIAAGIESGIPAIEEQVSEVQRLMREMKEAQAAADEASEEVSGVRAQVVRAFRDAGAIIATPTETAAERIDRITDELLSGQKTMSDFKQNLSTIADIQAMVRKAFQDAGVQIEGYNGETADERIARITQELISGQKTMEKLRQDLETIASRTQSYDSGGVLKPGYTLAYNGTGHDEYVSRSRGGTSTLIRVEEGAFQFNGPVDSATIPDVKRLLDQFIDELSTELRSN